MITLCYNQPAQLCVPHISASRTASKLGSRPPRSQLSEMKAGETQRLHLGQTSGVWVGSNLSESDSDSDEDLLDTCRAQDRKNSRENEETDMMVHKLALQQHYQNLAAIKAKSPMVTVGSGSIRSRTKCTRSLNFGSTIKTLDPSSEPTAPQRSTFAWMKSNIEKKSSSQATLLPFVPKEPQKEKFETIYANMDALKEDGSLSRSQVAILEKIRKFRETQG